MNISWHPSDKESVALTVTGGSPVPDAFTAVSSAVDVRGFKWVEFTVTLAGNTAGAPDISQLDALVEYGEATGPLAGNWNPVTSEAIDSAGVAPQVTYAPNRSVSGVTDVWRFPVALHGQQMRVLIKGNSATPGASSSVTVHALRRAL